ncbi:hypothetical protein [Methanosphaera sp. WGK6]|uniref:hypothetical protein n=1 Tax=Methanosphaera sp. WGK6 TaxID=1561964 RepID=UPI00084C7D0C|nr:hypothetical protein [Methanosphaera sp. WGK6]OED29903.1 hypothetical protein NL43_05690 [Methanosphaera sp. WGK6]
MIYHTIYDLGISEEIRFINDYLRYFIKYCNNHQIGLYKNEYNVLHECTHYFEDLLGKKLTELTDEDLSDIPKTLDLMWSTIVNLTELYTLNNIHVALEEPTCIINDKIKSILEKD